jgi:hypothetical protein
MENTSLLFFRSRVVVAETDTEENEMGGFLFILFSGRGCLPLKLFVVLIETRD